MVRFGRLLWNSGSLARQSKRFWFLLQCPQARRRCVAEIRSSTFATRGHTSCSDTYVSAIYAKQTFGFEQGR